MTRQNEALKDMQSRKPWKKLIDAYGKYTIYTTLNTYLPSVENQIKRLERKKVDLESTIRTYSAQMETLTSTVQKLEADKGTLEGQIVELHSTEQKLISNLELRKNRLLQIDSELANLERKGITLELVAEISEMDVASPEELSERLKTKEQYDALIKEVSKYQKELEKLQTNNRSMIRRLDQVREEIKSERNSLDEARHTNIFFKKSLDLLIKFQRKGYPAELLDRMLIAVDRLAIKGEKATSIRRFLRLLGQVKESNELEVRITQLKAERDTLKGEIAEVKGILAALKNGALKPIQETRKEAIHSIHAISNTTIKSINGIDLEFNNVLARTLQEILSTLGETQSKGESALRVHEKLLKETLSSVYWIVQNSLNVYYDEIQRWGSIKEEVKEYEMDIQRANLLLGILKEPETITTIPFEIIVALLERISMYLQYKFQDTTIAPPPQIANREFHLTSWTSIRITSLIAWLCFHMRNVSMGVAADEL
jgi:chromosome segregation ATPase